MSDQPPVRKARTRRLSCPGCGGSIEVRANGISISAICASCGRTIDVATDALRVIAEAQQGTRTLLIPIGTRVTLAGTEWEVIGYQDRSNPAEGWKWDEFLLFNPYRGFRFLAHDDEGWTLFCMLRQDIADPTRLDGGYRGPEASQARTDYVLGEFYWRIRAGDMVDVEQYEAGSSVLVKETTGDEIVWSRGFKLPEAALQTVLAREHTPTTPVPISQRQHTIRVLWTGVVACVLLVLLSSIGFGASRPTPVFQQFYSVMASSRGRVMASAPFTVPDPGGNLRLDLVAPVENDWVSLDLSLVPDGGGPTYDASSTIEYYTGRDSDGVWTEGDQQARIMFRSIPGGVYRLLVEADAGAFSGAADADISFSIAATRHAPAPELFWIALLLIVPYPLYRLLFNRKTGR